MASKQSSRRRYSRIAAEVFGRPWLITADKMEAIRSCMSARQNGVRFTREEIEARIGDGGRQRDPETVGRVRVVPVHGVVAQKVGLFDDISGGVSTERVGAWIDAALADESIDAIVLDVNSPGGQVGGVAELAEKIRTANDQKPVVTVANTQMASAAYWIGSAASEVVASPSAEVGSVGAMLVHAEHTERDAKAGDKYTVLTFGANKAAGNSYEALSAEARAILQERVDAAGKKFVAAVAAHRNVSAAQVRNRFGEGKMFDADTALSLGMIDRVETLDATIARLNSEAQARGDDRRRASSDHGLFSLEKDAMNPQIKSALVARGLITSESSDAEAAIALRAFFSARGATLPSGDGATEAIVAALKPEQQFAPVPPQQPQATDNAKLRADWLARDREIRAACKVWGIDEDKTEEFVSMQSNDGNPLPLESVQAKILQHVSKDHPPVSVPAPDGRMSFGDSSIDKFAAEAEAAIALSCGIEIEGAPQVAHRKRHTKLMDWAEQSLQVKGIRTDGMTDEQIYNEAMSGPSTGATPITAAAGGQAYHSVGSLPNLFGNVINRSLQAAYDEAPVTFRQWASRGASIPDFRPVTRVRFSEGEDLELRQEKARTAEATLDTEAESYAVEEYSKKWGITFHMMRNDDLSALMTLPRKYGMAAPRTLNKLCVLELASNPVMADGFNLFDSSNHGNLTNPGSAPTHAALSSMRKKMRTQTGIKSEVTLDLELALILVPAALEEQARDITGNDYNTDTAASRQKNQFKSVTPVIEPQLDAFSENDWYGFASPSMATAIEYSYLKGQESPVSDNWYDNDRKTRWYSVTQTFGVKAIDHRPVCRDDGGS